MIECKVCKKNICKKCGFQQNEGYLCKECYLIEMEKDWIDYDEQN